MKEYHNRNRLKIQGGDPHSNELLNVSSSEHILNFGDGSVFTDKDIVDLDNIYGHDIFHEISQSLKEEFLSDLDLPDFERFSYTDEIVTAFFEYMFENGKIIRKNDSILYQIDRSKNLDESFPTALQLDDDNFEYNLTKANFLKVVIERGVQANPANFGVFDVISQDLFQKVYSDLRFDEQEKLLNNIRSIIFQLLTKNDYQFDLESSFLKEGFDLRDIVDRSSSVVDAINSSIAANAELKIDFDDNQIDIPLSQNNELTIYGEVFYKSKTESLIDRVQENNLVDLTINPGLSEQDHAKLKQLLTNLNNAQTRYSIFFNKYKTVILTHKYLKQLAKEAVRDEDKKNTQNELEQFYRANKSKLDLHQKFFDLTKQVIEKNKQLIEGNIEVFYGYCSL